INGQLGPSELSASSYVMEIQQQTDNGAPGITLDGQWNVAQREFDAHISNLELTDQLRRTLPEPIQEWWQKLHLQGGIEQIGFHINSTDGIQLTAKLRDVSMILTVPSQKLGPQIVPISGLSGDVTAGNLNFRIINLSGTVMNSRFLVPAAEFDGYRSGDPFDVTVNMPDLNIDPHYPALFSTEKFSVASALIYRMRPSGLVDLSVRVSRQKNKPLVVDGQILCRDVRARYVHFPYPFEHAQGLIRFNSHLIDFVNTHAVAETYPLTLNGTVGINTENSAVNLIIRSDKCFFDQRLAECMPAELIPIWNKFNPVGFGSFICHVTRTQGDSGRPAFTVQIFPTDVSGTYVDFPYPLQHVHGELYFTEHQTQIINLTAPVNGGKGNIIFNGTVDYSPDAVNDLQPHVHVVATNIPVDQNLWNSLPDSYNRHLKPLNLVSGTTGLDAMITRGPEDSAQVDGTLTLTGGTLKPVLLPWLITNVAMQAHLSLRNVDILSLTGNLGQNQKGTFAISGHMYIPEVGATELDASGSWHNVQIGGAAPTSLPQQWQQVWNKWNPSGNLDGTLQVVMSMEESDTGQTTNTFESLDVSLEPTNMQLSPVFLPDRVIGIHGIVDVTPKIIKLKNLDAASGPITLTLNGTYNLGNSDIDLSLVAQAPRIPAEWIKVLPGSAAPMVRALDPQAAWMLDLGKLEYSNEGGKPDWQLTGSVVLDDLKLQKTINASAKHTTVTIAGDWAAGEEVPDIAGEFLIE
ncbi:MAG TPA: hypothetical protein VKJ65_13155, partial [Phycisphaerae bacterium]|nr:hypothetical protein [Phycisphaerae bacterium]